MTTTNLPSPVIAVELSSNSKTGPVSATYLTQDSCPSCCPLISGGGCYAETGLVGIQTHRLNKAAAAQRTRDPRRVEPAQLARLEARAIDRLTGEHPLRLHVVGDAKTNAAARILGKAAQRYQARGWKRTRKAQDVWTYTHAWRQVDRSSWGPDISVLASCETVEQAGWALSLGYAPALVVVEKHPADGKAWVAERRVMVGGGKGLTVIPCPAQTREEVQCVDCKLCWNDDWLKRERKAIGFEVHGSGAGRAARAVKTAELIQIGG